jgi:hypothetical protein
MLVVANGAFKSGSTWLRDIVHQMARFEPIPEPYQRRDLPHWIDPDHLPGFLDEVDYRSHHYLTKAHLSKPKYRRLLLRYPDVRILNITRDLRDTVVSHYYHLMRERSLSLGFPTYYWTVGRLKAYELVRYHDVWNQLSPQLYVSSFERLKGDFVGETRLITQFLGFDLTEDRIRDIQRDTSIERMRAKHEEEGDLERAAFFRKGEIGDWKNHLNERMLRDLDRISRRGLDPGSRVAFLLLFTLRRRY